MAASDQTYRSQKILDIVFAVSCLLMLASLLWMFVDDYNRDFKKVQKHFRLVDDTLTVRSMLEKLPNVEEVTAASEKVAEKRKAVAKIHSDDDSTYRNLYAAKAKQEATYQSIKADYDSYVSLWNIEIDKVGDSPNATEQQRATNAAEKLRADIDRLGGQLNAAQMALDATNKELTTKQVSLKKAEDEQAEAENDLKRLSGDFDRFGKAASQKNWTIYDSIRNLPVLDAFAAPVRIDQFTLADYPIDYSFKYVTRYDRCTTCHLGMERAVFSKDALAKLNPDNVPEGLQAKLDSARELFKKRESLGEDLGFYVNDIPKNVNTLNLSSADVNQFCVHPRLDLFVGENSPHRAERFGCTSCHGGQGSSTTFVLADHSPNNAKTKENWEKNYHWESSPDWDFPMLPKRFIESTCLKCHHQVTDLVRHANQVEAPKLVRGYNLVRENGCFGCHEISGTKAGREIGPDLRLELSPPLESMPPADQAKVLADKDNPPGTMRKVGPSLYRISEKTNQEWARKWIAAPRDFRPTTKMPHFYGLSNNSREVLPLDQKDFPDAEIHAIASYLFRESSGYLEGKDKERRDIDIRIAMLEDSQQKKTISDKETKELLELTQKRADYVKPTPIAKEIHDYEGQVVKLPARAGDAKALEAEGAKLFKERGCLACHSHDGTKTAGPGSPGVTGQADYGPDLSRLAAKIAPEAGGAEAKRAWLVQWIINPRVHFPRARMPYTYLSVAEADAVAAWFLSQQVSDWQQKNIDAPRPETLTELAKVYLAKAPGMTRGEVDDALTRDGDKWKGLVDVKYFPADADERELAGPLEASKLEWYIGRKAINRLGCFGCHDIPGFAASKPIGTQLNDWGKKDPQRLAFEDIASYVKEHYTPVESMTDEKGLGTAGENGKPAYEKYFLEALESHTREGFLNQKLIEPRSYDNHRLRTWDDLLRMPQFKFARDKINPLPGETAEQAEAREEAAAREAVMTFILGLVAEPVPASYVHKPDADRQAMASGRKVLEKYNCIGCHQVQPGVYEINRTAQTMPDLEDLTYQKNPKKFASEYHDRFQASNEWTGRPSHLKDRFLLHGVPDPSSPSTIRLTDALAITKTAADVRNKDDKDELPPGTYDIPASSYIGLPENASRKTGDVFGGTFAELMSPYLKQMDGTTYGEYKTARAALPPPLLREGEKAQPGWLYQFLLHPQEIRPATILRMPHFSMSPEEAMTLVNYFAAVDHMQNPGEGLSYPYESIAQRQPTYWNEHSLAYAEKLQKEPGALQKRVAGMTPTWERTIENQIADLEQRVKDAKAAVSAAKEAPAKKEADAVLAARQKSLDDLKTQAKAKKGPAFDELDKAWKSGGVYATDAYRLLANYNTPCLSCHQVGSLPAKNLKPGQGPPLDLSWQRLRPEWTLRWIANPDRLISYPTPMPQNFPRNQVDAKGNGVLYPEFLGTPGQQATAVRDVLLDLPHVTEMPGNRVYRPVP
jgi:mono/diheme cytochrome c family protein